MDFERNNTSGAARHAGSHTVGAYEIRHPEQIDRLITHASMMNLPGRVELLRAARDGLVNLIDIDRDCAAPMKLLEASSRPVVVVIGDDDYRSTGPAGWAAWQRLSYWARGAMVHATGGDAASYRLAVVMAEMQRRFLLIETSSGRAHDWGGALHRRNIQTIGLLSPDGAHPVLPAGGALQ